MNWVTNWVNVEKTWVPLPYLNIQVTLNEWIKSYSMKKPSHPFLNSLVSILIRFGGHPTFSSFLAAFRPNWIPKLCLGKTHAFEVIKLYI